MTPDLADRFAAIALGHVTREYPNKLDHVLAGPGDARSPADLHPVFYGSFDWHSCVHGYWMLAHLYRRFPAIPNAATIRALFDAHLAPDRIAGECAYLAGPSTQGSSAPMAGPGCSSSPRNWRCTKHRRVKRGPPHWSRWRVSSPSGS